MEMETIMNAISQYGFPAAVCLYALWQSYKQQERHEEQIIEMTKRHADEMSVTTGAINELRVAITELTSFLRGGNSNG